MSINNCLKYDRATTRLEGMVSDAPWEGGTWESRGKVATQIGGLDFECNFDDCGKCAGAKNCNGMWHESDYGCCNDCAFHTGYLDKLPPEAVAPLLELYDPLLGWWTLGGCSIPQKWRSKTCLMYTCNSAKKDTIGQAEKLFEELSMGSPCGDTLESVEA